MAADELVLLGHQKSSLVQHSGLFSPGSLATKDAFGARVSQSIVPRGNNATVWATLFLLSPSSMGDLKDFSPCYILCGNVRPIFPSKA